LSPEQALLYNSLDDAGRVALLDILKKGREEAKEEGREEGREEGMRVERRRGVCLFSILLS
jgi:predicted transposase YdaD